MPQTLLETPLARWHESHGGRMVDFAGWKMPVQYASIVDEHLATRNAAGMFDVSHMGRLTIHGPGVQGLDLPAEGFVSLDSLPGDTYRYDRASDVLAGRRSGNTFRLGDRVRVVVARVDLDRRMLEVRLVTDRGRAQRLAAPAPRRPTKPRRGKASVRQAKRGRQERRGRRG